MYVPRPEAAVLTKHDTVGEYVFLMHTSREVTINVEIDGETKRIRQEDRNIDEIVMTQRMHENNVTERESSMNL